MRMIRKITVLYNRVESKKEGLPEDILADQDTVSTARVVGEALKRIGYQIDFFEINEKTLPSLFPKKTDLFFNLAYGIGSLPNTEAEIPPILEKTGLPFTGPPKRTILLTTDKAATKKLFLGQEIPTPRFSVLMSTKNQKPPFLSYPLLVKPAGQDCSLGIDQQAVVKNQRQLFKRAQFLINHYHQPALVEEFINTRELNLTVIGNDKEIQVLPVSEIIYGPSYEQKRKWKILDFAAKWKPDSENYQETVGVCPAKLERKTCHLVSELGIRAYKAAGCRDYARIDIRLDENNLPYFLEINVNPGIAPEDGAIRSAKAAGFSYEGFLQKIVEITAKRFFKLARKKI